MLGELLADGGSVDPVDSQGRTPLVHAIAHGHAECIALTTYENKLMVVLLTVVLLGVLAGLTGYASARYTGGTILRSVSVKGYLLLIYIVLPIMSSMAFSAFNYDRVSDGSDITVKAFHT